jgi:hypothetical protein
MLVRRGKKGGADDRPDPRQSKRRPSWRAKSNDDLDTQLQLIRCPKFASSPSYATRLNVLTDGVSCSLSV